MRFAIVYSKKDVAGINIIEEFRKIAFTPDMPIIELKKESIFSEDLNEKNYPQLRNIDFIIFATKHRSEKGNPSLSVHAPGNFRQADFGGKAGKICSTSAFVLKYLFQELNKNAELDLDVKNNYEVTLEATHHGPLIEKPCCFIELGSSEKQWSEKRPAVVIAKTILSLKDYSKEKTSKWIPTIGIGGPHYCPIFNKIQEKSNYAIGHVIASYNLPITETMLSEAEEKTKEHVNEVLIDWKSFNSEQRQQTIDLIKKTGLKCKKTSEV